MREDVFRDLRCSGVLLIRSPVPVVYVFMESMVTDESVVKVLAMCDSRYAEKADRRSGGVGTESQIISQELYTKVGQTKFIPVVCERDEDGEPCLPVFMKPLIYVDVSSAEAYGSGLDELLRLIFEKPLHPEPLLGQPPEFLKAENTGALPMARELAATLLAIREGKPNRDGLQALFVRSVVTELDRQHVRPDSSVTGYDEEIFQAILKTKQLRDQWSEYADAVASFSGDDPKALKACIAFLEQLGERFGPPSDSGASASCWADLYRFFALESLLIMTAALVRHGRWQSLRALFKYPYALGTWHNRTEVQDITAFDPYIQSIDEHRNSRLNLNRASVTADLLKERCSREHTPFGELIQADFLLALDGVSHAAERQGDGVTRYWIPRTGVYRSESGALPLFQKAVDADIRKDILTAVGATNGADMAARVLAAAPLLDDFKLLVINRRWGGSFVEATNLKVLTKD